MYKKVFLILTLALNIGLFAQRQASWELDMKSEIKELVIDPLTGIVIVESQAALQAVSPADKKVIWTHEKSELNLTQAAIDVTAGMSTEVSLDVAKTFSKNLDIELIPNTNLFFLLKGHEFFILDIQTGEIKFNSVEKKLDLVEKYYMPQDNLIIAIVRKGIDYMLVAYDTQTLAVRWEKKLDKSIFSFELSFKGDEGDNAALSDKEGNYFLSFNRTLYKVDKNNGDILWKFGTRVNKFDYTPEKDVLIVYEAESAAKTAMRMMFLSLKKKGDLYVVDNQNGQAKFDKMNVDNFKYAEDFGTDMLIVSGKRFNRYSYDTGEKIWEKSPKGNNFSGIVKTKDGNYVYTADDEIMCIDKNGEKVWKKFVKITNEKESETLILEETDKGNIVYITETQANTVNLATGEKNWKRDLKLKFDEKRPTLAVKDPKTNNYYIYNDEKFYTFNEQTPDRPDEFSEVKIKKEKEVQEMFNIEDKLVVTGIGEIMGLDKTGKEIYHHYYSEPGGFGRGFARTALWMGEAYTGTLGNSTYSVNNGPEQGLFVKSDRMRRNYSDASSIMGDVRRSMKKRFDGSKNMDNYSYFFAKEEDKKVLVKVDRATGEEVDRVQFFNNRPKYDIDVVTNSIFYAKDNLLRVYE